MDAHDNGGTGSHSLSKLRIVSIMSVSPLKVTEPRRVCQVLASDRTIHPRTIQGCYQIVMYYEKLKEEDHGWSLAGWIVESLASALLDHPLLAGRLQRKEVGDETSLEIVSNDSGIRLLEAQYPARLSEFLEPNEKEHLEAELAFWKEIDAQLPEFSPLFYVQVTNFECGGYSIGISCSLLLAEVLVVDNFLNRWSQIHNNMLLQNQDTETVTPIYYRTRLQNPESLPSYIPSRTQSKHGVQSTVFKITSGDVNFNKELWRELAVLCVEDAERKLDKKMGSDFSLFVKESKKVIKVESCSKSERKGLELKSQILRATWDDFGVKEVAFHDENEPVHVSCWVGSVADGCVMAIPCPQGNACAVIVVSPPLET